jgi:hypothetical protein
MTELVLSCQFGADERLTMGWESPRQVLVRPTVKTIHKTTKLVLSCQVELLAFGLGVASIEEPKANAAETD